MRQPHFIHLEGLQPLALAGLWSAWTPERGAEPLLTFSILTRAAVPPLADLHDRMPVALPEDVYAAWLDPANDDVAALTRMIHNDSLVELRHYAVSLYVNNPKNEGPKCIEPLAAAGQGS